MGAPSLFSGWTGPQGLEQAIHVIFAMGGASRAHGLLALSLSALLLPHARRKGCQLFTADMKVRIDHDSGSWFYYPDLVLACDPTDREPLYVRRPCLLVEVLSPSTEHIDTREKLLAYRLLPSMREYLLLRQDSLQADLYQRAADGRWQHQRLTAPGDVLDGALDPFMAAALSQKVTGEKVEVEDVE